MPDVEFKILGTFEVLFDGVPRAVPAAKLRVLLASLLVDANQVVPFETLTERLWGERPPDGARNTLQNYVLRVRRLLGAGLVLTRPHGYLIELADGALDLHRFDLLVRRAGTAATADALVRARDLLAEALRLWRGRALSDVPSDVLRRDVVPALEERRLEALRLRIEHDLALGGHADVLGELAALTAAHPLRERFWAQRMLALHRADRRGESLECYRTVTGLLAAELGVDPGQELRTLHHRLLTADPALASAGGYDRGPLPTGNLPAEVTTFVGRERQLAELRRLLGTARLVTLTGVGGVGKTRLALRAAAAAAASPAASPAASAALPVPSAAGAAGGASFPHGVWLADLGPLAEPALLTRTV
ncbi:AfsR/SARP family transcriptional regulator, partial [Nonomuraea rhizosphaerae]|uniref:AfsR/SARP family transcriptional regulator n=1 Tax=Nonomuraea rhizosphaerae TaxID=2665663 RepID=UPI001C5F6680